MYLSFREAKPGRYTRQTLINGPVAAKAFIREALGEFVGADQEFFWAVPLNVRLNPGQPLLISAGGQSDARVDQRILFRRLLDAQAHAFICVHNHPAGSLKPSREDQAVTELLAKCGELIGIELLDHIIVSAEGARSLRHE